MLHAIIAAFPAGSDQTNSDPRSIFRMDIFHSDTGLFYLAGRHLPEKTFRQALCKASYYRCGSYAHHRSI